MGYGENGRPNNSNQGGSGSASSEPTDQEKADALFEELLGISHEQLAIQAKLANKQVDIAERNQKIAEDRWKFYVNEYRPHEQEWLDSVKVGIDPEFHAKRAAIDVGRSFDKASEAAHRDLSRMGLDPSSGRAMAIQTDFDLARAAAEAGARNVARIGAENVNQSRDYQAVAMGRDMPSEAATINASAANTIQGASATIGAGYGAQMEALGNVASMYDARSQNALDRAQRIDMQDSRSNAAALGGLGQLAGTLGAAAILA